MGCLRDAGLRSGKNAEFGRLATPTPTYSPVTIHLLYQCTHLSAIYVYLLGLCTPRATLLHTSTNIGEQRSMYATYGPIRTYHVKSNEKDIKETKIPLFPSFTALAIFITLYSYSQQMIYGWEETSLRFPSWGPVKAIFSVLRNTHSTNKFPRDYALIKLTAYIVS